MTLRLWNIDGIESLPAVLENRKALGLRIVQVLFFSSYFWHVFGAVTEAAFISA